MYLKVMRIEGKNCFPIKEINSREGGKFQNERNYRFCYTKKKTQNKESQIWGKIMVINVAEITVLFKLSRIFEILFNVMKRYFPIMRRISPVTPTNAMQRAISVSTRRPIALKFYENNMFARFRPNT